MGMPALSERHWTPDDVWALPDDGKRYECIDGVLLVSPSPRPAHQIAHRELTARLFEWLSAIDGFDRFITAPADIRYAPDVLVQPDLGIARLPLTVRTGFPTADALCVVIEILSPSTARYDRVIKRGFYQRIGVPEYWIVDVDARVIERWRPADERPAVLADTLSWTDPATETTFTLDVAELFRDVWDEP